MNKLEGVYLLRAAIPQANNPRGVLESLALIHSRHFLDNQKHIITGLEVVGEDGTPREIGLFLLNYLDANGNSTQEHQVRIIKNDKGFYIAVQDRRLRDSMIRLLNSQRPRILHQENYIEKPELIESVEFNPSTYFR